MVALLSKILPKTCQSLGVISIWHKIAILSGAVTGLKSNNYPYRFGGHQLEFLPIPTGTVPLPDSSVREDSLSDGILWAVPKKRTSHSKKRMRMTHKYLKPKYHYTLCPKCNNLKLLHVLCAHCLKETLRQTAEMRRQDLQQQLDKVAKLQNSMTEKHNS